MWIYYYWLFDRYFREVVSLAVLADWGERQEELVVNDNPFATVVLAHLAAQVTRRDATSLQRAKLELVHRLYDRGYSRQRVLELFRLIDWLLALPPDLKEATPRTIEHIEEERHVAYITSMERIGRAEGLAEGKRGMVRQAAQVRFGTVPDTLEWHGVTQRRRI